MIKLPVATLTVLTCISEYIKIITMYGWGVLLDSYYHLVPREPEPFYDAECCKRSVDRNNIYTYIGTKRIWTTSLKSYSKPVGSKMAARFWQFFSYFKITYKIMRILYTTYIHLL